LVNQRGITQTVLEYDQFLLNTYSAFFYSVLSYRSDKVILLHNNGYCTNTGEDREFTRCSDFPYVGPITGYGALHQTEDLVYRTQPLAYSVRVDSVSGVQAIGLMSIDVNAQCIGNAFDDNKPMRVTRLTDERIAISYQN
jgi:hypothetical protein